MQRLAERAGLNIEYLFHDSTELQFYGSEQYKSDVPFNHGGTTIFSDVRLRDWAFQAEQLNARDDGDHAVFILSQR